MEKLSNQLQEYGLSKKDADTLAGIVGALFYGIAELKFDPINQAELMHSFVTYLIRHAGFKAGVKESEVHLHISKAIFEMMHEDLQNKMN